MSIDARAAARRLRTEARAFRAPLLLIFAYFCCRLVFFHVSRRYGLLQSVSPANLGALLLGLLLLLLRLLVMFYVPLAIGYRLAKRALRL